MVAAAKLMMHPGVQTLSELRYRVPGYVDLVRTAGIPELPELALAWNYASVYASVVGTGDKYELDTAVSSFSAPTQLCTFMFKWSGNSWTSEFEVVKPPLSVLSKGASPHS